MLAQWLERPPSMGESLGSTLGQVLLKTSNGYFACRSAKRNRTFLSIYGVTFGVSSMMSRLGNSIKMTALGQACFKHQSRDPNNVVRNVKP